MTIPEFAMPTATDLYQNAIDMGANSPLAAYLVGSAYQESGFKPNQLGDYVNGRPTSFGLMQVGSRSLGSGSVSDQFSNYISALQSKAPDTWAAMNAAPTPEAAYAAQHANPDWRMGIPGNRFDYARQILGTPSYQQILDNLTGLPTSQTPGPAGQAAPMANAGGYQNLPAYLAQPLTTPAAATQPTGGQLAGAGIGALLQGLGKSMSQVPQQNQQLLQSFLSRPRPGAQILAELAANPQAYLNNPYLQQL